MRGEEALEAAEAVDHLVRPRIVDGRGGLIADDAQQDLVELVERIGLGALHGQHADQPVLDEQGQRELTLHVRQTGQGHHVVSGRRLPRRLHAGPDRLQVSEAGADVPDAHGYPPFRHDADHPLAYPDARGGGGLRVAAGRGDHERVTRRLGEEEHRVAKPEDPLHGAENDLQDLTEVEGGGDLG